MIIKKNATINIGIQIQVMGIVIQSSVNSKQTICKNRYFRKEAAMKPTLAMQSWERKAHATVSRLKEFRKAATRYSHDAAKIDRYEVDET